jgi:GT2 family glycosyltransferase
MKYTVVMPTMWRSKRTKNLLESLFDSDFVDEVILIDNNTKEKLNGIENNKLVYLPQKENIFVNPAWNMGVEKSNNEHVCLINDDISLDVDSLFDALSKRTDIPCVGMHKDSWITDNDAVEIHTGHHIGRGWGCMMILKKSLWSPIPNQMKIYRGDVWIATMSPSVHSVLIKARTEMETTSGMPEMREIKLNDLKYWYENIGN